MQDAHIHLHLFPFCGLIGQHRFGHGLALDLSRPCKEFHRLFAEGPLLGPRGDPLWKAGGDVGEQKKSKTQRSTKRGD